MNYIDTASLEKRIMNSAVIMDYIFARYCFSERAAIWFYLSGEKSVLDICIANSERFLRRGNYNKIILVSDFEERNYEFPDYIEKVKVTRSEIDDLIVWYCTCHPMGNMQVISMIYPQGRNDMDLELACATGILKLQPLMR